MYIDISIPVLSLISPCKKGLPSGETCAGGAYLTLRHGASDVDSVHHLYPVAWMVWINICLNIYIYTHLNFNINISMYLYLYMCVCMGTGQDYYLLSQIAEFYAKEDRCVGALVNWHPSFDLALFPYIILCGKPNHKPYLVLSVGGEYKWLINTKFYF